MSRVAESRQLVEDRLRALRFALESELGRAPKKRAWILALIAGAAGLSLALGLKGRRRRSSRS